MVAPEDVTLLADTLEIFGAVMSGGVYVTVRVSVLGLLAASRAVTVRTFAPLCRVIPKAVQEVVPVAVPLPPRLLAQVTWVTATLSDAVPPMVMEFELVL
jgi:hypothetical protein